MGVIQDGFYYPDVEEIIIGFQHETNWNRGYEDEYISGIVKLKDEDGTYLHDIEELTIAMDDGYAECRVPLLTKEQIEKEGWNTKYGVEDFARYFEVKGLIYKLSWEYWADGPHIQIWDTNFAECVYKGFCPTINHLRTIMKLLNIK